MLSWIWATTKYDYMAQASPLPQHPSAASARSWSVPTAWLAAIGLYALIIYGGLAQGLAANWVTDVAWTIAGGFATYSCLQAARAVSGYLRTAWLLFGAAFGCWFIGTLIWSWNELIRGIAVPFPSASEVFYVAFGCLSIAALFALRDPKSTRRLTPRNLGSLGLIVCSLAVAATTALLEPIARSDHSQLFIAIALAEALTIAVAFVFSLYFLWSQRLGSQTAPLVLIAFSFAVHATTALAYIQTLIVGEFGASHHLNIAWLFAMGFQYCAARAQIRIARGARAPPTELIEAQQRRIEALLPGLLLLSLVVAAAAFHTQLTPRVLAIDAALLALFAVILLLRESWMHARERQLKAQLESSNEEIDRAKQTLRHTLHELAETERALRLAATAGKVGIFEWDLRTNDVQYSVEWKRQLGYDEHEVGRGFDEWGSRVHPEDHEPALAAVKAFIASPSKDFQIETRLRHRNGNYRWILVQMSLQHDAEEKPASILGSHVDITRQKTIEAALRESETRYRELATDLELRVAQRTAQLEDAYQELESFAYAVSHDLKAPLRAIDGFSQLLLESAENKLDDSEKAHIVRVRRGALRMAALIDGLLAYSRVERRELHVGEVHLTDLLEEVLAEHEHEIVNRSVTVERNIAEQVVHVDREALMIVLRNLIDNALKFTRSSPHPTVRIGVRPADKGFVSISIEDNGIGFDQTYHDQIFSIFQRLHHDGEYEGTGIGLALARKAAQRMGGRLFARSAAGRGAIFCIELPAETAHAHSPDT